VTRPWLKKGLTLEERIEKGLPKLEKLFRPEEGKLWVSHAKTTKEHVDTFRTLARGHLNWIAEIRIASPDEMKQAALAAAAKLKSEREAQERRFDGTEALILRAIEHKRKKGGAAYAAGKTLIVFLDADTAAWFPNRVARQLPDPLHFATVWVVGLQGVDGGEYVYGVTNLDLTEGDAPTLLVRINRDFEGWVVMRKQ
jgi:hypothetical protein